MKEANGPNFGHNCWILLVKHICIQTTRKHKEAFTFIEHIEIYWAIMGNQEPCSLAPLPASSFTSHTRAGPSWKQASLKRRTARRCSSFVLQARQCQARNSASCISAFQKPRTDLTCPIISTYIDELPWAPGPWKTVKDCERLFFSKSFLLN